MSQQPAAYRAKKQHQPDHKPNCHTNSAQKPILGLTRSCSNQHKVVLGDGGSTVTIADGNEITRYELIHNSDGIEAQPVWTRDAGTRISALAAAGNGRIVAIRSYEDGSRADMFSDNGDISHLTEFPGSVSASLVAGSRLFAAVRRATHTGAILMEVDLNSGRIVSETPLASPNIDLSSSPSGNHIAISDRHNNNVATREVTGHRPCPPSGHNPIPVTSHPQPRAPDPCGCHVAPPPSANDSPCGPGQAGLPDDDGSGFISNGNGIGKRAGTDRSGGDRGPTGDHSAGEAGTPGPMDCHSPLSWTSDRLRWAGSYVVATQGNHMRKLAVLRASDMRVLQQRDFGNSGALVFANTTTEAVLIYYPQRGVWEWLDFTSAFSETLDRDGPSRYALVKSKTFEGQHTLSLIQGHTPTIGPVRVLVLPVVEPRQAYNEPDLQKLGRYLDKEFFEPTDAFYRENSFHQNSLDIKMLGYNSGPSGKPLVLLNPVAAYFYPPFFSGGVRIRFPGTSAGPRISFEGSEILTLHAQPRIGGRQADDFTLYFSALSLVSNHDAFPVKLIFNGSEIGQIRFMDRNGAQHTLNLAFPAKTLQISSAADTPGKTAVADFLDGLISTAANAIGFGGGVFAKPAVSLVGTNSGDVVELHIKLGFAPTLAPGPNRAEVLKVSSNADLSQIGFDNAIVGHFTGSGAGLFGAYLSRHLLEAQEEKGYTETARMFADAVGVTAEPSTFDATILLSDDDGGPGAHVKAPSISAASGSFTLFGSESTKDLSNAPKDMGQLINDAFTAALARIGGPDPVSAFSDFHAVIVGFVGAATGVSAARAWSAASTAANGKVREAQMMATAIDSADSSRQLQSRWLLQFLWGQSSPAVLAHELGHAYGFRDLYKESAHRADLRYLESWAMMGDHSLLPHHSGYHKWQAGWIPNARIADVPKPDPVSPIQVEALLVPTEYWDDGMESAVRGAFGGSGHPVVQLIRMDLGGDGAMFDLVEARQKGVRFSQSLPNEPALLITNAVEPWDDTRYALNNRYRRELHLLNTGSDLRSANDSFDLAKAPALPAKGITVKILGFRDVPRPSGSVRVFHVLTTREKADYIDLGFTISDPYYKNPDVWLEWPGADQDRLRVYLEGIPVNQGDQIRVPTNGVEPHRMMGRVHNYGTVRAEKVTLDYFVSIPPGAGDKGNNYRHLKTVPNVVVEPGASLIVPAIWDVLPTDGGHACLLVMIADGKPASGSDGIVLGSDDVQRANNHAQKNFSDFVAASHSPYEPIEFDYCVNNDGVFVETAYLEPINLPYGMKLTISPIRQTIQPKETVIFHMTLELNDRIINAGCRNDREFAVVAWREAGDTVERWGGVHYKIRPRKGTTTSIAGNWSLNSVVITGAVTPDPGAGARIRVRVDFDNQKVFWMPVTLLSGGSYKVQLTTPAGAVSLDAEALFEGDVLLAPSRSAPITVRPYVVK